MTHKLLYSKPKRIDCYDWQDLHRYYAQFGHNLDDLHEWLTKRGGGIRNGSIVYMVPADWANETKLPKGLKKLFKRMRKDYGLMFYVHLWW